MFFVISSLSCDQQPRSRRGLINFSMRAWRIACSGLITKTAFVSAGSLEKTKTRTWSIYITKLKVCQTLLQTNAVREESVKQWRLATSTDMKLSNLLASPTVKGSLIHEKILTCNQTFSFPRKLYLNEERITQDRSPNCTDTFPESLNCLQENKTSLSRPYQYFMRL